MPPSENQQSASRMFFQSSSMRFSDRAPAVMPCRKNTSTVAAVMFDVLEASDHIRNTAETAAEADDGSPSTKQLSVSNRRPLL